MVTGVADDGRVLFFGEDGLYEVSMDGSGLRHISNFNRGTVGMSTRYPPAIGGVCVDPTNQYAVWTENTDINYNLVHQVNIVDITKSAPNPPTQLYTKLRGEVLDCAIDVATQTLYFAEYNYGGSVSGIRVYSGVISINPFSATPLQKSSAPAAAVLEAIGGGIVFSAGKIYLSAVDAVGAPAVTTPTGVTFFDLATAKSYASWQPIIGYMVLQSDGTAIVCDDTDPTSNVNLVKVDLSDATGATSLWKGSPVSGHIAYGFYEGSLSPTISATDTLDYIVYLSGLPSNKISKVDLAGSKTPEVIYTASMNQMGDTGLGPIIWMTKDAVTDAPTMVPTPGPNTSAPTFVPTDMPTSLPAGQTAVPTSVPTSVPATVSPGATAAPVVNTSAPPTVDCNKTVDSSICYSMAPDCEWSGKDSLCIAFGSSCATQTDKDSCFQYSACVWASSLGQCLITIICDNIRYPDECNDNPECTWSRDIASCIFQKQAEESNRDARDNLAIFVLIGAGALCLLILFVGLCVYLVKRREKKEEERKKKEEEDYLLKIHEEEEALRNPEVDENGKRVSRQPPTANPGKMSQLALLQAAIQRGNKAAGNGQTTITKKELYGESPSISGDEEENVVQFHVPLQMKGHPSLTSSNTGVTSSFSLGELKSNDDEEEGGANLVLPDTKPTARMEELREQIAAMRNASEAQNADIEKTRQEVLITKNRKRVSLPRGDTFSPISPTAAGTSVGSKRESTTSSGLDEGGMISLVPASPMSSKRQSASELASVKKSTAIVSDWQDTVEGDIIDVDDSSKDTITSSFPTHRSTAYLKSIDEARLGEGDVDERQRRLEAIVQRAPEPPQRSAPRTSKKAAAVKKM